MAKYPSERRMVAQSCLLAGLVEAQDRRTVESELGRKPLVAGTMPIAGNSTAAGRQQSQRAELIVFGEVVGEQLSRRAKLMVISPG